ncbi:MAG: hypothetical protein JRF35_00755, partial [Deltaproteobacteria bacterium]|nr:hypothetical protein [Deltaproteobacteria bacterium]
HALTITPKRIENFFNRSIQHLARQAVFPKEIHAACDCTLYETTSKFTGCGSVTRQRKVKARGYRRNSELKEQVTIRRKWEPLPDRSICPQRRRDG